MKRALVIVVWMLLGWPAAGQRLELPKSDERILYLRELEYLVDTTNQLDLEHVRASSGFTNNPGYQNKDFRVDASYWIRIPIHHTDERSRVWLLELYDQTIDHIEAFV